MKKLGICLVLIVFVFSMGVCFAEGGDIPRTDAASEIRTSGTTILNAIMWFGYAISLGMVVFIGIKYILGSVEAKANMKSAVTSWLIGALIVFMASTIVGWVLSAINAGSGDGMARDIVQTGMDLGR